MSHLYIRDKSEFIKKVFDHKNGEIVSISEQEMEDSLKERSKFELWSFEIGDEKAEVSKKNIEEQIIIANGAAKEIEKYIGESLNFFTITRTKSDLAKRLTGDSTYLTTTVYFYMDNRKINKSFVTNWKELKIITRKFQSENLTSYTEERYREEAKKRQDKEWKDLVEEEVNMSKKISKTKKMAKYMVYFTVLVTLISFIEFN